MKILIVEDEFNLADAIKSVLVSQNYDVDIDTDGLEGLYDALSEVYDLIILDVMLPNKNGFEILKEIRENEISSKIIMLTAKSTIDDKMNGFNNGVDDYLTKPFHMDELLARVSVQLRGNQTDDKIKVSDLVLDLKKLNISNKNNNLNVDVIGKEFKLLELLMKNPNQVIDKEFIFNKIWGYESDAELNTLEAYISFIRKKLKKIESNVKIKAVRNMGYKLEVNDEEIKD